MEIPGSRESRIQWSLEGPEPGLIAAVLGGAVLCAIEQYT